MAAPRRSIAAHARPQARRYRRSRVPTVAIVLGIVLVGVLGIALARLFLGRSQTRQEVQEQNTNNVGSELLVSDPSEEEPDTGVDIDLIMVGDILFHYQVRMSGLKSDGSRNYDHIFAHVLDELKDKDVKVVNQETPIAGPIFVGSAPDGYSGYPSFNGPQEIGDAEVKAGFNVILRATNHSMDAGYDGVQSEMEFWKNKHPQVAVIGEVNPYDESQSLDDVYIFEKKGFKLALLNFTFDLNGYEDPLGCVAMLDKDYVSRVMLKAREEADMIVVFPHWGEEYMLQPVEMQYEWAQVFIDEGADVIIGNHPHVMEPLVALEKEDGSKVPCFWSTGNFVSTSPDDMSLIGAIAGVTLHKAPDGSCSVSSATIRPVVTHLGLSTDMTVYPITQWTDELAQSNWLDTPVNPSTYNTSLTPEWANAFCAELFGEGWDESTGTYTLAL